jgi:hypothetical protein
MSDKIYVTIDGEKREMNAEEKAQFEKDKAEQAEQQRLIEAEKTKKDADRASAMAKLSALGLNEQEVAALIN